MGKEDVGKGRCWLGREGGSTQGYQQGLAMSGAADTFVSVMCGDEGRVATYLSDVRLLFVVRAPPSAFAPATLMSLYSKL